MAADPPSQPSRGAPLADLAADEITGRLAALRAALEAVPTLTDDDVAWAYLPARSIVGLSVITESEDVAAATESLATMIGELATATTDERERRRGHLMTALGDLEEDMSQHVRPNSPDTVALSGLTDLARWLVAYLAHQRGVRVSIDVPDEPGGVIVRSIGGAILDALVHAVASAITYGTPEGGALRLMVTPEPDALVVILSDRGNRSDLNVTNRPDLSGDRGMSLRAAQSRIVALGGELSAAAGAWGGTTVTMRVPTTNRRRRPA